MTQTIQSVAVIGAGISGVCTAAHLLKQGLQVTVYERGSIAGGVWHYDPRSAHEQQYPNEIPSRGDYERIVFEDIDVYQTPPRTPPEREDEVLSSAGSDGDSNLDFAAITKVTQEPTQNTNDVSYISIAHSSPGPCYVNLKNNVSLTAMKTSLADWPVGLEEFVNQRYLEEYIQHIARTHQVNEVTRYNTRVEDARKVGGKWRVCSTTLVGVGQQQQRRQRQQQEETGQEEKDSSSPLSMPYLQKRITYHDALVVASGHYHMPRIPDIPGLREWKARYPDTISHSKGYRNASKYRGANVLIIGAGVSSVDIAKEIVAVGGTVYQSSRGGIFDLPATMLPQGAQRVGGVERFVFDEIDSDSSVTNTNSNEPGSSPTPLPGHILLTDNTTLQEITHIILATGYITSLPFLPTYHADNIPRHHATPSTLITQEGDMIHNLHRDIFYIEDPTLSFVGVPYHISTFSLFDFQAQVVARVYSSTSSVQLPSQEKIRAEYIERVRTKGLGREFHSLRPEGAEIEYVAGLVEWVNGDLGLGEENMQGHSEIWLQAHWEQREMLRRRFAGEV